MFLCVSTKIFGNETGSTRKFGNKLVTWKFCICDLFWESEKTYSAISDHEIKSGKPYIRMNQL